MSLSKVRHMRLPKKQLPAPCPSCGRRNGSMRIVVFNPKFRPQKEGYKRQTRVYVVLRIGHYMPQRYKEKRLSKSARIWHNFRLWPSTLKVNIENKVISIDRIFDHPKYENRTSVTFAAPKSWITTGWPSINTGTSAHYHRKTVTD